MAQEAVKRGFHDDRIHVSNYGIDRAEVQGGIDLLGNQRSEHSEGIFVGRFHPQKGLEDLIAIWKYVQLSLPEARLTVVGDGLGRPATRFKEELIKFGDQSVRLAGVLTGAEKYAAMSGSTVFLFPSHHESWGHVVLEAMAVGLPVIGYELPSSKEAFGDSIIQIPCYDVEAFARAVVRCLQDESVQATYRARGLATAGTYDWNNIARQFVQGVS
jgi:glycosyltransferase involved in cell wall biosynthesis